MNREYSLSKNSQANVETTKPEMQKLVEKAMNLANVRKMYCPDWGVSDGNRTQDQQSNLFKQGRKLVVNGNGSEYAITEPDKVVTYCDGVHIKSAHQGGWAIDIYCYVNGKTNYEPGNLALVVSCFYEAASMLGYDIIWGGNFTSLSDGPHIEITKVS